MDEEVEAHHHLWGRGRPENGLSVGELRRIQRSPEWLAAQGLITAAEYLMMFGDHRGPVELIEHENVLVGPPLPRHLRR